jgi:ribosomal protein S18 acetylase RimI-like enzyme
MNGEPSAHLETLAVAEGAEGQGVGSALMASAEDAAREEGARSMTLHVFETNERARALYARKGYVAEWIRCIKPLREGNPRIAST